MIARDEFTALQLDAAIRAAVDAGLVTVAPGEARNTMVLTATERGRELLLPLSRDNGVAGG